MRLGGEEGCVGDHGDVQLRLVQQLAARHVELRGRPAAARQPVDASHAQTIQRPTTYIATMLTPDHVVLLLTYITLFNVITSSRRCGTRKLRDQVVRIIAVYARMGVLLLPK